MNLTKNGITIEIPDAQVVDLVLKQLGGECAPIRCTTAVPLPAIGTEWPGQGGIFAGLMRGRDGKEDYALILGPQLPAAQFDAMQEAASAVDTDGHNDFRCPHRAEQSLLFANLKDQFQATWYWSCERHQDDERCAWQQGFSYGHQHYFDIDDEALGCAVRGVTLAI